MPLGKGDRAPPCPRTALAVAAASRDGRPKPQLPAVAAASPRGRSGRWGLASVGHDRAVRSGIARLRRLEQLRCGVVTITSPARRPTPPRRDYRRRAGGGDPLVPSFHGSGPTGRFARASLPGWRAEAPSECRPVEGTCSSRTKRSRNSRAIGRVEGLARRARSPLLFHQLTTSPRAVRYRLSCYPRREAKRLDRSARVIAPAVAARWKWSPRNRASPWTRFLTPTEGARSARPRRSAGGACGGPRAGGARCRAKGAAAEPRSGHHPRLVPAPPAGCARGPGRARR